MSGAPTGAPAAWRLGRHLLKPPGRPLVMGIVNLTPDSFHAGSRTPDPADAVAAALRQAEAGAEILDLGAVSSRPGAVPVGPAEEQARLLPALTALRPRTPLPITVDTTCAETARLALAAGADGINDIGGATDPGMLPLAAATGCGLVLMHMQGEPGTMQADPRYDDVVAEVAAWLAARAAAAQAAGVAADRIAVDPGIGFGKTTAHNLALLASLRAVADGRPLLLGASRKTFIGAIAAAPVAERLPGSLAALAAAAAAGATVVRVHDVAASRQFLEVLTAIDTAGRRPAAAG